MSATRFTKPEARRNDALSATTRSGKTRRKVSFAAKASSELSLPSSLQADSASGSKTCSVARGSSATTAGEINESAEEDDHSALFDEAACSGQSIPEDQNPIVDIVLGVVGARRIPRHGPIANPRLSNFIGPEDLTAPTVEDHKLVILDPARSIEDRHERVVWPLRRGHEAFGTKTSNSEITSNSR